MMNQGGPMAGGQVPQQMQPQQALYDQVPDQNFGNPYDCPEGAYGGSMISSVGYSKVDFWILIYANFLHNFIIQSPYLSTQYLPSNVSHHFRYQITTNSMDNQIRCRISYLDNKLPCNNKCFNNNNAHPRPP